MCCEPLPARDGIGTPYPETLTNLHKYPSMPEAEYQEKEDDRDDEDNS